MDSKGIIYVAYSPYENQGKILDYILETFPKIFLFSIGHHNMGDNKKTNKLTVFVNGKVKQERYLYHIPVTNSLVFSILPFRSILNLFQIIYLSARIKDKYGMTDIYFSVNGYAAWIGLVLKKLGLVKKTAYWICDYYPIKHKNIIIYLVRWIYWQFEMVAAKSDLLRFHNSRLMKVWKDKGLLSASYRYPFVPIGTDTSRKIELRRIRKIKIAFLGVVKKSQGLDYIFDSAKLLKREFPRIKIEVIGPGPDISYFKNRARGAKLRTHFYGYITDRDIDKILAKCTIGIAPYVPDPTSVSYFGDPGKIKRYISLGLPVIATNIHEFSMNIVKSKAGVIVTYGDAVGFVRAIKNILSNYKAYSKNAINLSKKFDFRRMYQKLFEL